MRVSVKYGLRTRRRRKTIQNEDGEGAGSPGGLPPGELERLRLMLERLMELGIGAAYADEEDDGEEASVDCERRLSRRRAVCCTFHFALTKKEAAEGKAAHDPARPFFVRRQDDGYCSHLDRESHRCLIWRERPLRCRKYDCRSEPEVWKDAGGMVINEEVFRRGLGDDKHP